MMETAILKINPYQAMASWGDWVNFKYFCSLISQFTSIDIIVAFSLSLRWGLCTLSCLQYIQEHIDTVEWPFIVLHGDADKLCALEGSQMLYDRAASTDKTIKVSCLVGLPYHV
jgi:hypothetical protein